MKNELHLRDSGYMYLLPKSYHKPVEFDLNMLGISENVIKSSVQASFLFVFFSLRFIVEFC
jgi:hypothetical protein